MEDDGRDVQRCIVLGLCIAIALGLMHAGGLIGISERPSEPKETKKSAWQPADWPPPRPTHEEWLSAADPHWAKRGIEEGEATELTLRNFRFDHGLRADGPYEADFFTPNMFELSEDEESQLAEQLAGQEVVLVGHFKFGKRWVEFVVHEESPFLQGLRLNRMAAAPFR